MRYAGLCLLLLSGFLFASFTPDEAKAKLHSEDLFFDLSTSENVQITASYLVHAASENDIATVQLYLDAGTPIDAQNKYGLTALIVAAQHHFPELVQLLLQQKANPKIADNTGRTALHEALALPYYYTAYDFTEQEKTPYSYSEKERKTIDALIQQGADPNAADNSGLTPLMIAAQSGNNTIVAEMIRRNGDASLADKEGKTAFDYANEMGHRQVLPVLLKGKLSKNMQLQLIAWKFSRYSSGSLALLLILVAFLLSRSARKGRMARQTITLSDASPGNERLLPLKCEACGSGIALKAGTDHCPVCNAVINVPPDYKTVLTLREKIRRQLMKAEKGFRRAAFFSGLPVRLLSFCIAIVFFALTVYGNTGTIGKMMHGYKDGWWIFKSGTHPDIWVFWTLLGGLIVSTGFVYYAVFLRNVNRSIPKLPKLRAVDTKAETTSCSNCGGTVEFDSGAIASCCTYCGAETLRTDALRAAKNSAVADVNASSGSLLTAMQQLAQLQQEAWGSLQRPLWAILAFLSASACWAFEEMFQYEWLMTLGWLLMLPAMIFIAYTFAHSFPIGFRWLALLLVAALIYFAWAAMLAGMTGAVVGMLFLLLLFPVLLIFLKIFMKDEKKEKR